MLKIVELERTLQVEYRENITFFWLEALIIPLKLIVTSCNIHKHSTRLH